MLLRIISSLILVFILYSCNTQKNNEQENQTYFKIGVLGLFKPQFAEITFPEKIIIKTDNNEQISVNRNKKISIELINSSLVLRVNSIKLTSSKLNFFTENFNPYYNKFTINIPNKINRTYFGDLKISSTKDEIIFIITQNTEDLVLGILSSESDDRELEYLKALSVIIRTYINYNIGRHKNEGYDFCDNTHCMVYYGLDKINKNYEKAVISTKREILTYNNNLIDVFFTGSCGGKTFIPNQIWSNYTGVYPYSNINCNYCSNSNHSNWIWKTNFKELSQILDFDTQITEINKLEKEVNYIEFKSNNKFLRLSKDEFRLYIGRKIGWNKILSNNFDFQVNKDTITFSGKGFGHCIGFCQEGAEKMSSLGKTYKDILSYYYPKAIISK